MAPFLISYPDGIKGDKFTSGSQNYSPTYNIENRKLTQDRKFLSATFIKWDILQLGLV